MNIVSENMGKVLHQIGNREQNFQAPPYSREGINLEQNKENPVGIRKQHFRRSSSSRTETDYGYDSIISAGRQEERYYSMPTRRKEKTRYTSTDSDSFFKEHQRHTKHKRQHSWKKEKTSFDQLLQTNPEVFGTSDDKLGVLIQFDENNITWHQVLSRLKRYFNFQPKATIRLKDGFLIICNHNEIAEDMVRRVNLSISGIPVTTYLKPIPPIYKDRILVEGHFTRKGKEVSRILKSCTTPNFKVKKLQESDKYLVIFENAVEFDNLTTRIQRLKLQDVFPKISKVCRTDCIQVKHLNENISEDKIKLAFADRSLISGEVTHVLRSAVDSKTAFVYFNNYRDAETVAEKAEIQEIKVENKPVDVSLYWTGIKQFLGKTSRIHCFLDSIEPDIIMFVHRSPQQTCSLKEELSAIAEAELVYNWDKSEHYILAKPLLSSARNLEEEIEQKDFERACEKKIAVFFNKYKSVKRSFSQDDRKRIRNKQNLTDDENLVETVLSNGSKVSVFVRRWEERGNRNIDHVKVVGIPHHIKLFLEYFDRLFNCGIIEDVKIFELNIWISATHEKNEILLSGSRETVNTVQKTINKNFRNLKEQDITFLQTPQQEFLRKILNGSEEEKLYTIHLIQTIFLSLGVKVSLQLHAGNTLKLVYAERKRSEFEQAQLELKNFLKQKIISVSIGLDAILEDFRWYLIKTRIESRGNLLIFPDNSNSCLVLVGYSTDFDKEFHCISDFILDKVTATEEFEGTDSETTSNARANHLHGSKSRHLVSVLSSTSEYREVVAKFRSAGLDFQNVIQLQRVENKRLHTQFLDQKQQVERRLIESPIVTITRQLFHGTTKEFSEEICKNGFDRNYAGTKTGTKFGHGMYFATSANYSHRFADPDSNGHRRIFLADVITGEFIKGWSSLRDPPRIEDTSDYYDSVVDDTESPNMFIVFKDACVFPLYILTYV